MADLINLSNRDVDSETNLDGYDAYDNLGNKLGGVDGVIADASSMQPRYLVIDTGGWFSSKKFVVPVGDIKNIDDDDQRVYFTTLTKDTLQGGSYPQYDETWWDNQHGENFVQHEQQIAQAYQPNRAAVTNVDYNDRLYQRPAEGARRLALMEERLKVDKQRFQAGAVKIGKRLTTHTETVNVPVREERVIIERTPATGAEPVTGRSMGEAETIEVPVMSERVNVTKEPVVTEQVNIRKEATERTQPVQEQVRQEELVVDGDGKLVENRGANGDGNGNGARRAGERVVDRATPDVPAGDDAVRTGQRVPPGRRD